MNESARESSEVITAEAGLTPRARFAKVLKNLESGKSDVALVELKEYLNQVPNSSKADNLVKQITTAPEDYFPAEYFTIELKSGQSLSTIAKRYLGSAWEFYALSKYNNIDNPGKVNIGSTVKVPLTQLARSVLRSEELAQAEQTVENTDASSTENTEVTASEVPAEPEKPSAEVVAPVEETPVAMDPETLRHALAENNALGNFSESVEIVSQLKQQNELNSDTNELVVEALQGQANSIIEQDPISASSLFFEAGQLYLQQNDELNAFFDFRRAAETNPDNDQASELMQGLQSKITEKYHRDASTAFRKQSLEEAIAKWDIVLQVDPNHSNALAYRTQAIELQERLKVLQEN